MQLKLELQKKKAFYFEADWSPEMQCVQLPLLSFTTKATLLEISRQQVHILLCQGVDLFSLLEY